jgi:hypothetical protein
VLNHQIASKTIGFATEEKAIQEGFGKIMSWSGNALLPMKKDSLNIYD